MHFKSEYFLFSSVYISRIKAVQCVTASEETFLISASSDGQVKVWYLDLTEVCKF